jgi:hypothetical protein
MGSNEHDAAGVTTRSSTDDRYLIPQPSPPEPVEKRPHALSVKLSGAAVAVAILSALFTGYQACEARQARLAAGRSADAAEQSAKLASDLNELTAQSVVAAKNSAEAANRSATAADKQADAAVIQAEMAKASAGAAKDANLLTRESIRARVTVSNVTLQKAVTAGEALTAVVLAENSGGSEATNVRVQIQIRISKDLPEGDMPTRNDPTPSVAVIAPRGKTESLATLNPQVMTAELVKELTAGAIQIYVFGIVTYETFGQARETRFCLSPDPQAPKRAKICPKWNSVR